MLNVAKSDEETEDDSQCGHGSTNDDIKEVFVLQNTNQFVNFGAEEVLRGVFESCQ